MSSRTLTSSLPLTPRRIQLVALPLEGVWWQLLAGLVVYEVIQPVLALAQELLKLLLAAALHQLVASEAWRPLVAHLPVNPVDTDAAMVAAGGAAPLGLAFSGALGAWLHTAFPASFLAPSFAPPGAFVSLVMTPGAPPLNHAIVSVAAVSLWLFAGLTLTLVARQRALWLATVGLLLQAQAVIQHVYGAQMSLLDVNVSGLPFAVAELTPGSGQWFTEQLASLAPLPRQMLLDSVFLGVAYGLAGVATALVLILPRVMRYGRAPSLRRAVQGPLPLAAVLALAAVLSPVGSGWRAVSNWQPDVQAQVAALPLALPDAGQTGVAPVDPSSVYLVHAPDDTWQYLVNGQPTVIKGVGYNPQYADLPVDQRQSVYQRDFAMMHSVGVNTIEGWYQDQFDEVTLQAAAQNDIGVLMPFDLDEHWDYSDPAVQQSLLDAVSAWVLRYKDDPAVRMWAPGNEDVHHNLFPHWITMHGDRVRADAFAQFLPTLVDRIHQLDPNHPVIYRDAEDGYMGIMKPPFDQTGGARPWLVYGTNVYVAARLQQIVQEWPQPWFDSPLVVSEFAPSGLGPADRPASFLQDWSIIRSRPGVVLGGLAYTWATNGPEELDKVFGLVDPEGVPTDNSLAALAQAYSSDQPAP